MDRSIGKETFATKDASAARRKGAMIMTRAFSREEESTLKEIDWRNNSDLSLSSNVSSGDRSVAED